MFCSGRLLKHHRIGADVIRPLPVIFALQMGVAIGVGLVQVAVLIGKHLVHVDIEDVLSVRQRRQIRIPGLEDVYKRQGWPR